MVAAPDGSVRVFIAEDRLVVGTKQLSPEVATNYLQGKASAARLADEGDALGKDFGGDKPYNGLYVNMTKVNTLVSSLASGSPVTKVLGQIDETALTLDAGDAGMSANLRVMLKSGGGGE